MNTRFALKLGLTAASLSVLLLAPTTEATTFMLQAASGHPHLSNDGIELKTMYDDSYYIITDGHKVHLYNSGYAGSGVTKYWDVPIPLTGTNRNWSAKAYGSSAYGGTTGFNLRICSFTSSGVYSNCGSTVGIESVSTVFVPTDGTAFAKTMLRSECIGGGFCGVVSRLYSIKAND